MYTIIVHFHLNLNFKNCNTTGRSVHPEISNNSKSTFMDSFANSIPCYYTDNKFPGLFFSPKGMGVFQLNFRGFEQYIS